MTLIAVSRGQGITQALAQTLGLSKDDCKKIGASNWQTIVSDINSKNSSIFTSRNNDVSKIANKSQNHSNFVIHEGSVEIDDGIFNKIKSFILSILGRSEANPAKGTEQTSRTENVTVAANEASNLSQSTRASGELNDAQLTQLANEFVSFDEQASNTTAVERQTSTLSIDVLGDDWRALVNKKDKTEADMEELDSRYRTGMVNLANARIKTLDKNNDGVIDEEEFKASEEYPEDMDEETALEVGKMQNNAFGHLDMNGDGKISSEEFASYFAVTDYDFRNGGQNGKISVYDYASQSYQLAKDASEEGGMQLDKNLKIMYNKMFGSND